MMSKQLAIQLCSNVWLEGNSLISYSTRVAKIRDGKIWMNGRYSRTTTKQMHKVAAKLGLGLETNPKAQPFYQYEDGVRVNHDFSLSPATSRELIPHLKYGLREALALIKNLPQRDWLKVETWLRSQGDSVDNFLRKREFYQLGNLLELA